MALSKKSKEWYINNVDGWKPCRPCENTGVLKGQSYAYRRHGQPNNCPACDGKGLISPSARNVVIFNKGRSVGFSKITSVIIHHVDSKK